MKKRKIILDCDPGHDDAIAILCAIKSEAFDILGITVVQGNQTLQKTAQNALNVVSYLGRDIKVYLGNSHPIKKEPRICDEIHGETGLDGFEFPKYDVKFGEIDGESFIISQLSKFNDVTIVTTGPMTNLAKVLLKRPDLKSSISEIVFMGGSFGYGNISPAAEFNIFVDPEAADVIVRSGIQIKMIGLDVTRKFSIYEDRIEEIEKINNNSARLFCDLMKVFLANERRTFSLENAPLHDPLTILHLLDNSLIKFRKVFCEIDLSGGPSYGRTNCDMMNYLKMEPNIEVAVDIDASRAWNLLKELIRR